MYRTVNVLLATAAFLVFGTKVARALDPPEVKVSGYEFFPGVPCTLDDSETATCGVTFGGWTGGNGATAGGWTPFPGNRKGFWWATIDRQGTAGFGSRVTIKGGTWKLLLRKGFTFFKLSGVVLSGTVEWPPQGENLDCGTNVGRVEAELLVTELGGAPATFDGCLHDLPVGAIIPPRIWGTFAIY
jgi:hypothetical protein